jgi:hypothetical protein
MYHSSFPLTILHHIMHASFYSVISLIAILPAQSFAGKPRCKPAPGTSDWPTPDVWSNLNTSLNGRLIQTTPSAAPCYPSQPSYDPKLCEVIASQWMNSTFHASDPTSTDYPTWVNNSCNPIFPNGSSITGDVDAGKKGCGIGRYPVYVVNATEAVHVEEAVKFAAKTSVRLVIKNTGHSFPGRSTGFGALS